MQPQSKPNCWILWLRCTGGAPLRICGTIGDRSLSATTGSRPRLSIRPGTASNSGRRDTRPKARLSSTWMATYGTAQHWKARSTWSGGATNSSLEAPSRCSGSVSVLAATSLSTSTWPPLTRPRCETSSSFTIGTKMPVKCSGTSMGCWSSSRLTVVDRPTETQLIRPRRPARRTAFHDR
ncbi:hypothetical protein [Ornithinimicrobium kibberense]|uniref:hypothetical protein n=1 Tax=Ornithinimicrobium kibberense TaxID=282060 RepID=UPI0036184138